MLLDMLSRVRAHSVGLGGAGSKLSTVSETGSVNSSVRAEPSYTSFSSNELASSSTSSTVRQSALSTMSSTAGSVSFGSGSSRASKRHSNNLFNAGQTRDLRYMRKTSNRTISSNRSVLSSATSDSTSGSVANALIDSYADGQGRPITPENDVPYVIESPSPVSAKAAQTSSLLHTGPSDDGLERLKNASARLSRQLTQGQMQRISMSLEGVFREIEEEADDQVLVPRTSTSTQQDVGLVAGEAHKPPVLSADDVRIRHSFLIEPRVPSLDINSLLINVTIQGPISPNAIAEPTVDPTAMNWISDVDRPGSATEGPRSPSPYRAGGSTSPVPRVPGYIPGMPRPVTPVRNADFDEVRSHSTTPRASSPTSAYGRTAGNALPLSASASNLLRQGNSSPTPIGGRPGSPLASKHQSGRVTPEERLRNGNAAADHSPLGSHWRRPSSPLSSNNGGFQSLNGSRPGTPSNVTWNVSGRGSGSNGKQLGRNGTLLGHSRSQSNSSLSPIGQDGESSSDSAKNTLQSPRPSYISSSPDNTGVSGPRSKFLSNGSSLPISFVGSNESSLDMFSTPPSSNYHNDFSLSQLEEPVQSSMQGKPGLLSPTASSFQGQNGNDNPLYLSPLSNNSSRSSLVSAGSSYHSWEEENGFGAGLLISQDRNEPPWHEITPTLTTIGLSYQSHSGSHSHITSDDPESILRQFTGLSKFDLRVIQDKLLEASHSREKNTDLRSTSALRRRRPSVSQSAHPNRVSTP